MVGGGRISSLYKMSECTPGFSPGCLQWVPYPLLRVDSVQLCGVPQGRELPATLCC